MGIVYRHVLSFYCYILISALCVSNVYSFELTLLHTNDVHARIEEADVFGGTCSAAKSKAGKCFGGVARRHTVIEGIRRNQSNVLLLDAGDEYQGTLWFNVYKGKAARIFMNKLKYDAMAIGNHEFDNGIDGFVPFLRGINFPVLSANMDVSKELKWPKSDPPLYQKSQIFDVGGEQIGVIGYTTPETTLLADPGPNIKFMDEVQSIQQEANRLKQLNINKIIALGHSGIDVDIKIAQEVPDVDIVIGGHSNTFMYTGSPPSTEKPYSDYPYVVSSNSQPSKKILVVQDYTFGKYLGNLTVTFDQAGNVISYGGNPILLDNRFPRDSKILLEVQKMSSKIREFSLIVLGKTHVFLDGRRSECRLRECNMGNLITDALVHMNRKNPDDRKWADVSLAMWNGGSIRSSINKKIDESITLGDVKLVLPFENTADIIEIKGEHLLQVLEHSVTKYSLSDPAGRFLQLSGFRVTYDLNQDEGKRVADVKVRCSHCRVPKFEALEKEKVYKVIVPKYVATGGDDFQVFVKHTIKRHIGNIDTSLVAEYIKQISPITIGLEDRITFISKQDKGIAALTWQKVTGKQQLWSFLRPKKIYIALRSAHRNWLTAANDGKIIVNSNNMIGRPEEFQIIFKGGFVSLKTWKNKYFTAKPNGKLEANENDIGQNEQFHMFIFGDERRVAFKSAHGKWLSVQGNGMVEVNSILRKRNEEFIIKGSTSNWKAVTIKRKRGYIPINKQGATQSTLTEMTSAIQMKPWMKHFTTDSELSDDNIYTAMAG